MVVTAMPIEVKLPSLGDQIDSGDVLEVKVQVGDVIKKDQGIIELETDKATVEVPSTHAGKVLKIHVKDGETIKIGAALITLEESAGPRPSATGPARPASSEPKPAPPAAPAAATASGDTKKSPEPAETPQPGDECDDRRGTRGAAIRAGSGSRFDARYRNWNRRTDHSGRHSGCGPAGE
jgi:pyruvate dehydrogenase E2 component (dihydrolipoamide acetyltransferase)